MEKDQCLGPMDEGSRAGLHFSCCGHVAERLVKLLTDLPEEPEGKGRSLSPKNGGIPPVTRIDAFGLKNLSIDIQHFEAFADSTGVGQLRECFNEIKSLSAAFMDKDLPVLLLPENANARRRKYPFLSLEKVYCVLEKYVGTGLVRLLSSVCPKLEPQRFWILLTIYTVLLCTGRETHGPGNRGN